ncbi:MAG: sigma-70 family RNA polymerase sigma factor [Archaeoglobaceae archaeon]
MWERSQELLEKQFKGLVISTAKRFLPYSSMDMEDFLSEGKIVLFQTLRSVCNSCSFQNSNKCFCKEFFSFFLNHLRQAFSKLADIPCECKLFISKSKKPISFVPITESWDEEIKGIILKVDPTQEEEEEEKKDRDFSQVFKHLTSKERQLILYLEQGKTLDEITTLLGFKHKQGVYMMIKRIREKVVAFD